MKFRFYVTRIISRNTMTEIIPNLFLGTEADSRSHGFYNVIINCTTNLPFHGDVDNMRIPVEDTQSIDDMQNMLDRLPLACSKIGANLSQGKPVLVHCRLGAQRSACVIAAYLMSTRGMSADDSIAFVQDRRREAFFHTANFLPCLHSWESLLKSSSTS